MGVRALSAALGIALHSAWAVVVAVAVPDLSPILLDRRRIELARAGFPIQAYHAAAASRLTVPEATAFIEQWLTAAVATTRHGLALVGTAVRTAGCQPVACGIAGEERELPPLAAILRSHPLLHAAEGQLARAAVAEAASSLGLTAFHVPVRGSGDPHDRVVLAALGQAAGPPWAGDQKRAALAALAALRRA